jgi:hypothetical protein
VLVEPEPKPAGALPKGTLIFLLLVLLLSACARQLNNQVTSLLSSCTPCLDCGDTCTIGLLSNHGEEQLGKGFSSARFGLQHNTNF